MKPTESQYLTELKRHVAGLWSTEAPMTNDCDLATAAISLLSHHGIKGSWEHPGYIEITNDDSTLWAVGTLNGHESWEMDLVNALGVGAGPSFNLGHPKTGSELAELIMEHIDKREQ